MLRSVAAAGLFLSMGVVVAPAPAALAQESERGAASTPAVRVIAPSIVAVPRVEADALERVAPRGPLSELGQATTPEISGETKLFGPVASAAGRFTAMGLEVEVAGIRVVDADRFCEAADRSAWPCGKRARTAFRYWLRGRAVDCDLPEGPKLDTVSARCTLAGQDLGAWLVAHGWALAEDGGPYEELEEKARRARKGVFGSGPAGS